MSLHPQASSPIPEQTWRIARAAFPQGTLCMHLADALGPVFPDQEFAHLFPRRGQPAEAPARLALVTVLQFVENLPDRQAADAVRGRLDWKYALALELDDPGFHYSVLSEFRSRLIAGQSEHLLLDRLLERLQELGLLTKRGRQRTDSTHVLAAVRSLSRLERVGETLRAALNSLAVVAPDWVAAQVPAEWVERYGPRVEHYRLPKGEAARQQQATLIGADGRQLLAAIEAATDLSCLAVIPAVQTLRQVWEQQYEEVDGRLVWRAAKDLARAEQMIASPYDVEARYSSKREVDWVGYKAQITESCDADRPRFITNVETTPATTPDEHMLAVIHDSLAQRDLLPAEHLVDRGYTGAAVLVESQRHYGVTVVGPVAGDSSWQAHAGQGFDKSQFQVDWERQQVTCPAGHTSHSFHRYAEPPAGMVWLVRFSRRDCTPCAVRAQCTKGTVERTLELHEQAEHEALQQRRREQTTEAFQQRYAARAGIEGTHQQTIARCGLRRSRYIGQAKTHLQQVITAVAINIVRLTDWWASKPRALTRQSPLQALNPSMAVG